MQQLRIDQIGYDKRYYPRVNGDTRLTWMQVNIYKEALVSDPKLADARNRKAFPPITVVRSQGYDWPYLLIDGLHRREAFIRAGHEFIWAEVERIPRSKWLERAVELNADSKLGLGPGDKKWVTKQLLATGYTAEKITGLLQMTTESFERLMVKGIHRITGKAKEEIPIGRGNREIEGGEHFGFIKAPFGEVAGTANAIEVLKTQGPVSTANAMQIVSSFVVLLESGCVNEDDERIMDQLGRAMDLLRELLVDNK